MKDPVLLRSKDKNLDKEKVRRGRDIYFSRKRVNES